MGRNKIPEETKRAVMTLYYGSPPKSFGQIAKIVGIAKSTVYRILNEGDRQDRELDLGRVLAVVEIHRNAQQLVVRDMHFLMNSAY